MTGIKYVVCAVCALCLLITVVLASDGQAPASQPASQPSTSLLDQMGKQMKKPPATQPAAKPPTTQPAASAGGTGVIDQMQKQIQANPALEPTQRSGQIGKPGPEINVSIDPKILGHAPGMPAPKLRREGDFVINRRGRLRLAPGGQHALFAFDADGAAMSDPPMVLVPCEMLELMEKQVQQRGERTVFKISGQILTYRKVNYLLPTMVKLDIDRGNLGR